MFHIEAVAIQKCQNSLQELFKKVNEYLSWLQIVIQILKGQMCNFSTLLTFALQIP